MPADILAAVDAARNGQTRSAWLVQAARDALGPLPAGSGSNSTPGQAALPGVAVSDAEALAAYSARVGGRLAE